MKLLIKNQYFVHVLMYNAFLFLFEIQTAALLECTLIRYTLHNSTHLGVNDP